MTRYNQPVNGYSQQTVERGLEHPLARLDWNPRKRARRKSERRKAALVLLPMGAERRSYAERRRFERRAA